jgi:hypothetical protein
MLKNFNQMIENLKSDNDLIILINTYYNKRSILSNCSITFE